VQRVPYRRAQKSGVPAPGQRECPTRAAVTSRHRLSGCAGAGRAFRLLAVGSAAGLLPLGILASRVRAFIVYEATPRDPMVLVGVVVAMSMLGLVATWIPGRRLLSIDPMVLLREE
jgi:hypothetical protein